jgi:hypothetical protein
MKAAPNLNFSVVKPTEKSLKTFVSMLRQNYINLTKVINGSVGYGDGTNSDNISGNWATATPPNANVDFVVTHNLGRVPVGYHVMSKSASTDIYTGSVGGTKTQITLRSTVAGVTVKLFIFCLLLAVLALGAFAQTTNITLQVTDLGGQSWNNGTWSVVLSSPPGASQYGPPFYMAGTTTTVPNQSQSGALGATGSASITLTQNAVIAPSLSQWKFQVCPQATSGCFSQFVTITSSTGVTLTPPAISIAAGPGTSVYALSEISSAVLGSTTYLIGTGSQICTVVSGGACTTWTASGGGLTPVASLPGTCTPGTTQPVRLTVAPFYAYSCGPLANQWTVMADTYGSNVITAAQLMSIYGAKFDAHVVADVTTTNTSNIVSCSNSDCFFTSTDNLGRPYAYVGEPIFATQGTGSSCLDAPNISFGGVYQTTILSIDSAQQIHVTGNSNTSAAATTCLFWGDDDTTAINSAWTAGGCGAALQLAGGMTGFSLPILQQIAGCPSVTSAGTGYLGQRVTGQSLATFLVPLPGATGFNFANCPVPGAGGGCVGNANITDLEQFTVWGLGQRCSGNNIIALLDVGSATSTFRVDGVGWGARTCGPSNVGILIGGGDDTFEVGGSNFFGSTGMNISAGFVNMSNNSMSCNSYTVNSTWCLVTNPASRVFSFNNSAFNWDHYGIAFSLNDYWIGGPSDSALKMENNAVLTTEMSEFGVNGGAGSAGAYFAGTGAVLNIGPNNIFQGGASQYAILGAAGNTINVYGPNNTFTNGGGGVFNGLGSLTGEAATSNGVLVTAAKLVLSGNWGASAAWSALSGGDAPVQGTITNGASGTGANPTIAYTFPSPYLVAPFSCTAIQTGGTNPTGTFTSSALSATSVTFAYSLTPTASDTEIVQITCVTP